MTTLSDLPLDILLLIFPYLDANSFLSLCATCQSFNHADIRLESSYWYHSTREKFRVRNRPVIKADGLHWQRLYKRLLTQSRVFTWGQNKSGCLGHSVEKVSYSGGMIPRRGIRPGIPRTRFHPQNSPWPEEVQRARELGIIADIQCGGWSTSLLNDKGVLYTAGILNGVAQFGTQSDLKPMIFPAGSKDSGPHIAIRQFSSGRQHILGLSDDGTIWSWFDTNVAAIPVSLRNLGSMETGTGKVRSVVAGWSKSSAYLPGTGVIVWNPIDRENDTEIAQIDEWVIVPRTGYQRPKGNKREPDESTRLMGQEVGELTSYIVLEQFVIFVTDIQKVFAARIHWDRQAGIIHDSFELPGLQILSKEDTTHCVTDIQGSFRTFAVFKNTGEVIIADQDYLNACLDKAFSYNTSELPVLKKIPALQHTGVISLAFGDYHYHALHSDGSISSYGTEPSGSGALGLGSSIDAGISPGMLRGIKYNPWNQDGKLLPHGYFKGRRIWFQHESENWLRFVANGGKNPDESRDRIRMVHSLPPCQGEVSEWIEQMGANWDKRPEVVQKDDDGLGAYFALSVAAAGWHSGALVLVNDKLVQAVSESCIVDDAQAETNTESSSNAPAVPEVAAGNLGTVTTLFDTLFRSVRGLFSVIDDQDEEHNHGSSPEKGKRYIWTDQDFPRLQINGVDMPGEIPMSTWKEKPDFKLDWRGQDFTGNVFGVTGWEIRE